MMRSPTLNCALTLAIGCYILRLTPGHLPNLNLEQESTPPWLGFLFVVRGGLVEMCTLLEAAQVVHLLGRQV